MFRVFFAIFMMTVSVLQADASESAIVNEVKIVESESSKVQWVELQKENGDMVFARNELSEYTKIVPYERGDAVFVEVNGESAVITDFQRKDGLWKLFAIFVILVLIVGKIKGAMSLLAMLGSLWWVIKIMLPMMAGGTNPLLVAVLSIVVLVSVTFVLSHGFSKSTAIAMISTVIAIIIASALAVWGTDMTHLSGFASEEAGFLDVEKMGLIDIRALLISGMIIGMLGVLDDVTVSQVSVVKTIREANDNLSRWEVFQRAMEVGRDHVSSMVNTLVLVYAGAAMPLMLLFQASSMSFSEIINSEVVAEELVRMLVGSIGLVLAVPITTVLACRILIRGKIELSTNAPRKGG